MLTANMSEDLTAFLPLKSKSIGISYTVEGLLNVRAFDVSKACVKLRFTTDENFDAKVFQTLQINGKEQEEEEIQGRLEVLTDREKKLDMTDREKKLDKTVKIAVSRIQTFLDTFLGVI